MENKMMEEYYEKKYAENSMEAFFEKDSEYLTLKENFYKHGNKVLEALQKLGPEYEKYHEDWFMVICAVEYWISKKMYLLGAEDREKML
ncbi:MAG: hypothetical protein LUE14_10085 [Clostridiales bacterium]|nr:hypothetical protein [Clostridiales bacterium]